MKNSHNTTIREIVTERNSTQPARAAIILAEMVALAELDNRENPSSSDGHHPIGAEMTWMLVRTMCTEFDINYQYLVREARDTAARKYAEIKNEAHEIDRHDRFAVPDPNKLRASQALIEMIENGQ